MLKIPNSNLIAISGIMHQNTRLTGMGFVQSGTNRDLYFGRNLTTLGNSDMSFTFAHVL